MNILQRSLQLLDVGHFTNADQYVPSISLPASGLELPDDQYVLRMMIKRPGVEGIHIPPELEWLADAIEMCVEHQRVFCIDQPFMYVTVRSGIVRSVSDDEWHVDGFSARVPHVPEQNYVWVNRYATQHLRHMFKIPDDFDPLVHNLHQFFQDQAKDIWVRELATENMHMFDPYVVHRRPQVPVGTHRTFFRVSFVPIEIEDDANTPNPLLPHRKYDRCGIAFRKTLKRYGA